ncbi:hypothetical protein LZ32DRAFT_381207 [Colletotrichum eremochloae]|nr:hypothetical protein LZ32DRAFT_381207 [Colletotrichum eremochloae]
MLSGARPRSPRHVLCSLIVTESRGDHLRIASSAPGLFKTFDWGRKWKGFPSLWPESRVQSVPFQLCLLPLLTVSHVSATAFKSPPPYIASYHSIVDRPSSILRPG